MANGSPASGTRQALPTDEDFRAFYDRTSRTGYSLALRITGDAERAGAALEASYAAVWKPASDAAEIDGELLGRIRVEALDRRPTDGAMALRSVFAESTYTFTTAVRDGITQIDPLGRRAVELAYFGGIGVTQIAEILGEPAATVRAAMRRALLELGSLVRDEQETRV